MENIIVKWLFDNYPWLVPSAIMCVMTWKVSQWSNRINETIKKVGNIPCEDRLSRIESQDLKIDRDEEEIRKTNDRIDSFLLGLSMGGAKTSRKNSPYRLTDFGEYVLAESQGNRCVDENKDYLFSRITNGLHSTPYDVERSSLRAVLDLFNTDRADRVKDYIYNAPETVTVHGVDYRLSQIEVQVAMAIYLRDLFLENAE